MTCEPEKPKTATACDPCGPAVRNRYFRGKLMTVADYEAEQRYMIRRRRLINRALHGWGVVSGFEVDKAAEGLTIQAGVAIDSAGRELVACGEVTLTEADDLLWLCGGGACGLEAGEPFEADEYVLSAHYAERDVNGVRVLEGCDRQLCEENYICETVVYSLRRRDECPLPFLRDCRHDCEGEPQGRKIVAPWRMPGLALAGDKGADDLCRGIGDESCGRPFDPCGKHSLCRTHGLRVDLDAGVPVAVVRVALGECEIAWQEVIQIIRDCALTRIEDVAWCDWIERPSGSVRFSEFAEKLSPLRPEEAPPPAAPGRGRGRRPEAEPVDTCLWVRLSGPVQVASLRPDVMTITLVQRDTNEDIGSVYRVPIRALWVDAPCEGDPPDTTRRFRPMISQRFWNGEIDPNNASGFEDRETLVEIEIRTDFIVDWFGREVAGWGRQVPSRGTVPGGRFLSSIIVEPDPASAEYPAAQAQ